MALIGASVFWLRLFPNMKNWKEMIQYQKKGDKNKQQETVSVAITGNVIIRK